MYKRMLVPLDGSRLAELALIYAKELAGRLDIDMILLHVRSQGDSELDPIHRVYVQKTSETVEREAQEIQQRMGIRPGGKAVRVHGELAVGSSAEEILRYVDKNDIDLILMTTHGHSGIKRWAIGSVADKVLRASRVPVCLVRAGIPRDIVGDKWLTKTMLIPLDGSELAESVLPHVEALAKQRGSKPVDVVLLSICELPVSPSLRSPDMFVSREEYEKQEIAGRKQASEQYLSDVEKRLKGSGINVRTEVLVGKPADEIIDYANKNRFNLIVISTHGESGVSRWAYGSVADKVLHGASSPVFLVRRHLYSSD